MGEWIGFAAGAASDLLGLSADAPPRRRYNRELEGTLNTQIGLAPDLFAAESSEEFGQPAYARLALRNLGILAPGYEDIFGGITSRGRTRSASDLSSIAPGLFELYANLNPDQAALLGQLNQDALTGLQSGNSLSAGDVYNITNPVRMDWANRGLGTSGVAQLDEAVRLATAGEGLRSRRQDFGSRVAGLNLATSAPAFDSISRIGTDSGTALGYGSLLNPVLGGLGPLFQPESQYAGDINNQQYQTTAAINAGNAANNAAFLSSLMGMSGAFCWAAREVFGVEDPRWEQFRDWLFFRAPNRLFWWYLHNGEKWAERLRQNPTAKAVVRRWMERRVAPADTQLSTE